MKKISACPGWLALTEDRTSFVYLPARAEVVRKIFELSIGGLGSYAIANYLNSQNVPAFGPSPMWDNTTIDGMLRNRATFGEYQPKSFAGGNKKGVPIGVPVSGYYPAAIDEGTFNAAQAARRRNLVAGRGRKGRNIANIFSNLVTCGYCGSPTRFHRNGPSKSLVCSKVLSNSGCFRAAWSYPHFELSVLCFLTHPALVATLSQDQKDEMTNLVGLIGRMSSGQAYAARVEITSLLSKIISELRIASAGSEPGPRAGSALIRRDLSERFFEIRLWEGPVYRGIAIDTLGASNRSAEELEGAGSIG
jgi:hypothetical protein